MTSGPFQNLGNHMQKPQQTCSGPLNAVQEGPYVTKSINLQLTGTILVFKVIGLLISVMNARSTALLNYDKSYYCYSIIWFSADAHCPLVNGPLLRVVSVWLVWLQPLTLPMGVFS